MKVHKNCKQVKDIVNLWYETQMGFMKRCYEAQAEFAKMMWELHEEINKEETE